jgi:predicted ABC-type sugar transport system permease subunit
MIKSIFTHNPSAFLVLNGAIDISLGSICSSLATDPVDALAALQPFLRAAPWPIGT